MSAEPLLLTTVPAPAGDLTVVVTPEDGAVRVAGFSPVPDVVERIPEGLAARGLEVVAPDDVADHPTLERVVRAVERYATGEVGALDDVPVVQPGGPFFQRAWAAMRAIPAGTTATYTELAAAAGSPLAVRAAGSACARNLVAPFVPCHRVLRTGGLLGGYYFGLDVKRALLTHEGAEEVAVLAARPDATGAAPHGAPSLDLVGDAERDAAEQVATVDLAEVEAAAARASGAGVPA